MKYLILFGALITLLSSCNSKTKEDNTQLAITENFAPKKDQQIRMVRKATIAPELDGVLNDPVWKDITWNNIDQRWLGEKYTEQDFKGRYKLTWTPEALYIAAEITDDLLYDQNEDPLKLWWDDDCLEIFIDADNSGGGHQYTHNAFAYHVALDGNVVDLAPGEIPTLYNSHITSKRKTVGNTTIWECELLVYEDTYIDNGVNDQKVLEADQKMGFAIAYCDNDSSEERENFIGSIFVEGEDKNRGWIDAGIFGTIRLID